MGGIAARGRSETAAVLGGGLEPFGYWGRGSAPRLALTQAIHRRGVTVSDQRGDAERG